MNKEDEPISCLLKLTSGDTVVGLLLGDDQSKIMIQYPALVHEIHNVNDNTLHTQIFFSDWLVDTKNSVAWIRTSEIISCGIPSLELAHSYFIFLKASVGSSAPVGLTTPEKINPSQDGSGQASSVIPESIRNRMKNYRN